MSQRLAYLGPQGTFSEEAALLYSSRGELVPFPSISAVAQAVLRGEAGEGVVPIENSIEGSVAETLDLLIHEPRLFLRGEVVLPIRLYLLARPGTELEQVSVVFSHPQALGQCRQFLRRYLPGTREVAALSTASAVEAMMADSQHAAAIATRRAGKLFHARVIARRIQDYPVNLTRFVVLALEDHPPTGYDRTSLCFSFGEDRSGLLAGVLQEFASRGINLMKIESRPRKKEPGRYHILVDLEGHREEDRIAPALARVREQTILFRIFGSYPRY